MKLLRLPDAAAVARAAADALAAHVARQPALTLGLPTGRTMVPWYAELAARHRAGTLDLSEAHAFNLDELCLPPDHPASFRAYMEQHAFAPGASIGLDRRRWRIPDGSAADPAAECARYDQALAAAGDLELAILGLGEDGHVAYNLPGPPQGASHRVTLPDTLAETLGAPPDWRPLRALTLGFDALQQARHVLILATGPTKRQAVNALIDGPEDPAWPCSLLRGHPGLVVMVDAGAGGF